MVRVNERNLLVSTETDRGQRQLFSVLMRRRFWLLSVLSSALTVAIVFTLISKPTYQSTMQLLIEPNSQGKKEADAQSPSQQVTDGLRVDDYATQINVMRSSLLLEKAVDFLRPEYPTITVNEIKNNLVLKPVLEHKVNTKIVEATYTADDPVEAQKVLEAIYRVYQVYNREQQEQRLKKGLKFINEQIPVVSNNVDQAENKLEQFRKKNNLIDPEQQAVAVTQSLNAVGQERQLVRTQYRDMQARYTALQQQLASSPQQALVASRLSQSSRYQTLLNELQKTELALAQRRLVFTDEDPSVKKLLGQRQETIEMLKSEGKRVLGGTQQAAVKQTGENLLTQGQFGGIDLNLTNQLVDVQTNLSALRARDVSLTQTQQQLRADLNRFPVLLAEYNRLLPSVQVNRDKLQQLLKTQQQLSLEIAQRGFEWQALEEPPLGQKTGPNLQRNLLLGLVAGLLLGSIAAYLREAADDSVRSSEELEKQVELPLLGTTPKLQQDRVIKPEISLPFGEPQLLAPWTVQVSNWPPSWESLDLIFKNIQMLNEMSSFKSLMLTSAVAGEGKSTLALGLALSAARFHQRVLLIDADLRRPNLHQMLNLPNEQGLSTLLRNDTNLPSHSSIQSSGAAIDILTAGPTPADPVNLLSSQRMRELIAEFEKNYDLILLDASPVLGMVDAIIAASLCSGVVLVSRIGQVTKTELAQATAILSKLNVIGVVANGVNSANHANYGYAPYNREDKVVSNKV